MGAANLERLEGNAHTLSFVVEGRPSTVPTIDGGIYLNAQQLCSPMYIRCDLNS